MKKIYTALFISALLSCSKEKEVYLPVNIVPNKPAISQQPVFNSSFTATMDASAVSINSILNTRGGGNMDITGMNDNAKIEIQVRRINQTNNSSGVILIGFYDVLYSEKETEGPGWRTFYSKDERLGIYNDKPLTDSIVSGYFSATISADTGFTVTRKVKGDFKVRF